MPTLLPWQPEAVEFGLAAGRWVLGDPPGAGKTPTGLTWLEGSGAQRALAVVPNAVLSQWVKQAITWAPSFHPVPVWGPPAARQASMSTDAPRPLFLTSYDLLRRDYDQLVKLRLDTLIADEAHRLKDRAALQTRQATKLARRVERACFMTGTPVVNEAEELWSYLHMIDPKGYPSFWRWAREHFEILTPTYGYGLQPVTEVGAMLPGHAELIRAECRGRLIQRTPADIWPDKRPPVETVVEVELSGEERRIYDQLTKKKWVQLGGEIVQTSNAVATMTRARQLASDWRNLSDKLPAGSKVEAAVKLARWLDRPAVILTAFRATAELIAEELGATLYLGGMSEKAQAKATQMFRKRLAPHFVGTLGAVGEGLDGLQHTSADLILVDQEWSPARDDQVVGRVDREGQGREVNVWRLVAQGTVDEMVVKARVAKAKTVSDLDLSSLR